MTESELLDIFRQYSIPTHRGIWVEFMPTDKFITELTLEFGVEFAGIFTMIDNHYFIYPGTSDSINIPIGAAPKFEILLKHSHPSGTAMPSIHDINWLIDAQQDGSPQKKSIILPSGKKRITFNRNSPFLK